MTAFPTQTGPCPKCGGARLLVDGAKIGLEYLHHCDALYCTMCGFAELYVTRGWMEQLAQDRAKEAAREAKRLEKEQRRR